MQKAQTSQSHTFILNRLSCWGYPPEFCLVCEDTKAGVDAAASAGMVAVAVPNQFTLTHDFVNAQRIISSYEEDVHNKFIRQSENGSFGCSISNHVLPNQFIQSMKTSAKATFPQHRWVVTMLLQKDSGFLDVAGKIRMSDNECRHQFDVCHFSVVPVFYA